MTRFTRRCHVFCLFIGVLLFAGIGCQPQTLKNPTMSQIEKKSGKKLRTTPAELRLKIHHAAIPLSGLIEAHADRIINDTTDPTVRKNALLWKINGIPAVHRAAFQPDPFFSFLDLWVLTIQMRLFFEEGAGKRALGRWHTVAHEGSRRMEKIMDTLAREASAEGDIAGAKSQITGWCRDHPIESLLFLRKSITVILASKIGTRALGTLEIVEAVAVGVADLSVQMAAYADYLPKQARWQTELLLEDLAASDKAEKALSEFVRMAGDIDRLTALAETAPGAVAAERAIILKALTRDLDRALAALDAQRIAATQAFQNERVAVMDDVKRERAGLSADITAERIAMLKEVERQRQETLENIEAIGKRLIDSALVESTQNIDHFFFRVLQVGGLLVAVVLIFCAGAIYYVHRGRR